MSQFSEPLYLDLGSQEVRKNQKNIKTSENYSLELSLSRKDENFVNTNKHPVENRN